MSLHFKEGMCVIKCYRDLRERPEVLLKYRVCIAKNSANALPKPLESTAVRFVSLFGSSSQVGNLLFILTVYQFDL